MTPVTMTPKTETKAGWNLSMSGARRAADRARNAARVAGDWAIRSGVGLLEAAEAASAAERALQAADRASIATSQAEIHCEAAIAWAAAEAALEADRRTAARITAAMWAELDSRVAQETEQAA